LGWKILKRRRNMTTNREIIIKEDYALVPLTQGKFAFIDKCDAEFISKWTWQVLKDYGRSRTCYAVRNRNKEDPPGTTRTIRLHRVIINALKGVEVDHINRDGLDNRRCNLRVISRSENMQNTVRRKRLPGINSKYKGLTWLPAQKKWRAVCGFRGKAVHLGCFDSEMEAAHEYDNFVIKTRPNCGRTNFKAEGFLGVSG